MKRFAPIFAALLLVRLGGATASAGTSAAPGAPTPAAEPPGRRLLAADYSTRRIALLAPDGRVEWEYPIRDLHDLHLLPNGHVLFQTSFTRILEVDPRTNRVVWEYDAARRHGNDGRRVEVHAFQRLRDGATMIVESGPARILEVDRAGRLLREIRLRVEHPDAHSDTRLARKLANGHYLVCHERDGAVREYDASGRVVWEYAVPLFGREPRGGHGPEAWGNQVFAAVRLPNGNTLLSTGNGHGILEVNPAGEIVWQLGQRDLPGITLAWVTTLEVLPNGNIVFGNCHAGPENPQIVEITRDRRVVWSYRDFRLFGNALSNSLLPEARGRSLR